MLKPGAENTFKVSGCNMTFVAGLFWQTLTDNGDVKIEMRKIARQLRHQYAVLRKGAFTQAGFCAVGKPSWLSAAAIISKSVEMTHGALHFVCITQVASDRWLFVAQRDGAIVPDGDVVGSKDVIAARLDAELLQGDPGLVLLPPAFGGNAAADFATYLPTDNRGKFKLHRWWQLMPVERRVAKNKRWLLGGLAFAVLSLPLAYFLGPALSRLWSPPPPPLAQPSPVFQIIPAGTWAKSCLALIGSATLKVEAWSLHSAECSGELATIEWVAPAKSAQMPLILQVPSAVISSDGTTATHTINFVVSARDKRPLPEGDTVGAAFHDRLLPSVSTFTVTERRADIPPEVKRSWEWQLETDRLDEVLSKISAPGVTLTRLAFKFDATGASVWTLEGELYAN